MLETYIDQLQTVRILSRETPSTPRIEARYEIAGLLRRGIHHNGQTMLTDYEDFQLSPQDAEDVKGMLRIPLTKLRALRDKFTAPRAIVYGIDSDGMQVRAGPAGQAPHIPVEMEMAPYSLPKGKLPIPYYAIHWPGLLPFAPEVKPEQGKPWDNIIEVTPSLPPMAVKLTCNLLYRDHMYAHLELTIQKGAIVAMVDKIELTMRPEGSWVVIMNHETGQFVRSSGQVRCTLDGKGPADPAPTEILNYVSDFRFITVPLQSDDQQLTVAPWKPFLAAAPDPKIPPKDPAPPHNH